MPTITDVLTSTMDLVNLFDGREEEMRDWWAGTATGGTNGDGLYPMTNSAGVTTLFPCIAKIVSQIAHGVDGLDAGIRFAFSGVAAGTPPVGGVRFSHATAAATTSLLISNVEKGGSGISTWLDSLDDSTAAVKGKIMVRQGSGAFAVFNITGAVTSTLAHRVVPVVCLASGGNFLDGQDLVALDTPTGPQGLQGDPGIQGNAGAVPWATPVPWSGPGVAYQATPPANLVTNDGSTYVCLVGHMSSATFGTDLTGGKWFLVARKGTDGAGTGNVNTSGGVTPGNLAVFGDDSGTQLVDGGPLTKAAIGLGSVENKSSTTIRGELTEANVTTALGKTPGAANGLATLDVNGKVPTSQLDATILGGWKYQTTWNASTNTPAIPAAAAENNGWYYRVSVDGATVIDGINDWVAGDWIVSNGTIWEKIDNTDKVTSVAGKTGTITLVKADVGLGNVDNTSDANKPLSTAQQAALDTKVSVASKATTVEAQAGIDDDHWMSAAKTKEAIIALGAGQVSAAKGYINGLRLSNNFANQNTHVDVTVGKARSSDDTSDLTLGSALTKNLAAVWAAGSGNGGLDQGSKQAGIGYHVYLIYNPTLPAYDALFSTSATNPVMPTGYTKFRRLGAVMTDLSGNIRKFVQVGNWFMFKTRLQEWATTSNNGPNIAYLRQIAVPQGKKMLAKIYFQSVGTNDTLAYLSGLYDPDNGIPDSLDLTSRWAHIRRYTINTPSGTTNLTAGIFDVWTDANRQIYTMSNDALDTIAGGVVGWMDDRSDLD